MSNDQTYCFDQKKFQSHIKYIKLIGVLCLVLVTLCALICVLVSTEWSNYETHETTMDASQTVCSYLKHFDIEDNVILSVCNTDGHIVVDIRVFLNDTATIRGIPLNLKQWKVLLRVSHSVNRAIEEANLL